MVERDRILRQRLRGTTSLARCAQLVCDHLVALGYPLPSLYLRRSDRLRCFGASGYWQVLDGFPPSAGVIAETVRTGRAQHVDVALSATYLAAAPSVVAEVCVPIVVDDATVGALNIESPRPLAPDTLEVATMLASLFAQRMAELGGLPQPTGWMYLADQAARLVQIDDPARLYDAALEAADVLSLADSGIIAVGNRGDGFAAVASRGPLGGVLAQLPSESLGQIGGWVDGPSSCYTVGAPAGEGFTGFDQLRLAGVGSLMAVALVRGDEQLGFILAADGTSRMPTTEMVEQLELLASLVSSALVNARHLRALADMARRDPLTGLGHQVAFSECLHAARSRNSSFAVLAIDIDHFKSINDNHGHERGNEVLCDLADAMSNAVRVGDALFRTGGDEFAAVVSVTSLDEAIAVAQRLEHAARALGVTVSIGVAFADGGDSEGLYGRADAALYEAKRAGRNLTVLAG